jgi:hypothetical protein
MLNSIPVIGWILDLGFKISLAIPFWFIWTVLGIGRKYFSFLPEIYQAVPFWDCVGVFMVVPILYKIFVPKIFSVSNQQKVGTEPNTNRTFDGPRVYEHLHR